jgi:hypothetical protein
VHAQVCALFSCEPICKLCGIASGLPCSVQHELRKSKRSGHKATGACHFMRWGMHNPRRHEASRTQSWYVFAILLGTLPPDYSH